MRRFHLLFLRILLAVATRTIYRRLEGLEGGEPAEDEPEDKADDNAEEKDR